MTDQYIIHNIIESLNKTLISYLEMKYHIKDESLIQQRHKLLTRKKNIVYRPPYVEATPIYKQLKSYKDLDINPIVKQVIISISTMNVGIYPTPYKHQTDTLKAFFNDQKDIIISTGTGSGKTESFLMPILGNCAIEANERPDSARKNGCRAILLYPLNALVNDQLGRLRKIFGNIEVANIISNNCGRMFRFGAYNSRTPYPGPRSSQKDTQYIKPLFKDFYLNREFYDRKNQLTNMGKWPAKDLDSFYGKNFETSEINKSGKHYSSYQWNKRLKTQILDRELLTRHEMHITCPDILITNYSMLEYMLMRPIERPIFQQTKNWLASDKRNELIIVIDEAHTYRGTGGAEVALLIRRLQARLDIPRERIRFILTSASLGEKNDIIEFAHDFTGLSKKSSNRKFEVITGEQETRTGAKNGTKSEAESLASFNVQQFLNFNIDKGMAIECVNNLAQKLGWNDNNLKSLHQYLYDNLTGFGPAETLIKTISDKPVEFTKLSKIIFPNASNSIQEKATSALLSLCTFAKRESDGRVLLPTRIHLFYRGLSGLYACINPNCNSRLDYEQGSYLLGTLHITPRTHCNCGGRVYELITHQDCGSAFIKGYINNDKGDFLLHEPAGNIGREISKELIEIILLVENVKTPFGDVAQIHIDIQTGKIIRGKTPKDKINYLQAYVANKRSERINGKEIITFDKCPVCERNISKSPYKMMSFTTKGEGAFANLVKSQIIHQPPQYKENQNNPNAGRKSLIFSDGRQKAARLALFIPREVELDSFRQVICLATQELKNCNRESRLTTDLYLAFIAVISKYHLQFFDQKDQHDLRQHIQRFKDDYESDLSDAIIDRWDVTAPPQYYEALLRQLCHPFYSLQATTIGYVKPSKRAEKLLFKNCLSITEKLTTEDINNITLTWINDLLKDYAFNKSIPSLQRNRAANYYKAWGHSGKFRLSMKNILRENYSMDIDLINKLQNILCQRLCDNDNDRYFLSPTNICLVVDLKRKWYHCKNCAYISPVIVANRCPQCSSNDIKFLTPNDPYIKSRKRFFRDPVLDAFEGGHPRHITAEEHTAQLSQKDSGELYATTEKHELRFQDIILDDNEGPIDVLSCTTTMEVGVDIGSLVAVGLRNVPPQLENYQQRAGRTGRRGASISTVITYAQGGHHDSYYFHNPEKIIAGQSRKPVINISNEKIAKRHVHAFLFQTFFHDSIDKGNVKVNPTSNLFSVLGNTKDFFNNNQNELVNFNAFVEWIREYESLHNTSLSNDILKWLPDIQLPKGVISKTKWLDKIVNDLINRLNNIKLNNNDSEEFLNYLFDNNFLPTYAFPRDLVSFIVEEKKQAKINIKEQTQRNIALALSEYAPGRLIVINKTTYRSGGITSNLAKSNDINKAEQLFNSSQLKLYVHCTCCSYVQDTFSENNSIVPNCPICDGKVVSADMLVPERFHPEAAKPIEEYEDEQEITYAGSAQFPIPVGEENLGKWKKVGQNGKYIHAHDRRLVIVNTGKGFNTDVGFEICVKCGAAIPINSKFSLNTKHKRPYLLNKYNGLCSGETRQVILGTTFLSDLLLVRIPVRKQFSINMKSSINRNALEEALRSLAEALLLSASIVLDVDPAEFRAGFRIVPNPGKKAIDGDIYLFDSLSGGAGYSDQAGEHIYDILHNTMDILKNCIGQCERSCQDCLRHYGNQYWHDHLDRYLALDLLDYVLTGKIPENISVSKQKKYLLGLKRLLELDGYELKEGKDVPYYIVISGKKIYISICHGLMEPEYNKNAIVINKYFLDRNLAGAYQMIKEKIPPGYLQGDNAVDLIFLK